MSDSLKIAEMEIHRAPKHHIQIGGLIFSMAKKRRFPSNQKRDVTDVKPNRVEPIDCASNHGTCGFKLQRLLWILITDYYYNNNVVPCRLPSAHRNKIIRGQG